MPTDNQTTVTLEEAIGVRTEADAVADIARDAAPVYLVPVEESNGVLVTTHVYDRDGRRVDTINHEQVQETPDQTRGIVKVHTPAGLVTYATRHVDTTVATLWGDVDTGQIAVVLNDHCRDVAGWADHQVRLSFRRSPEWEAWRKIDGQMLSQTELAEFLEEHTVDIVDPDGARMLEVAQTFHATTGARFKRAQSLHSGEVQLTYEEEVTATAGKAANADVPRDLTLRLRPFLGTDRVEVRAMFRFRVHQGTLTLGVRLLNLDDIVRDTIDRELDAIAGALGLDAIHGTVPEPRR